MNVGDALAVIERFFLDIIGSVFAGALLLFLLVYFFTEKQVHLLSEEGSTIFLLLGSSYALGHFLTFAGGVLVEPIFRHAFGWIRSDAVAGLKKHEARSAQEKDAFGARWSAETLRILEGVLGWTNSKRDALTLESPRVAEFISALKKTDSVSPNKVFESVNEARNLALSVEGVEKALVHRFTFLGLFNLTTASAITVAVGLWALWNALVHVLPSAGAAIAGSIVLQPRPFSWLYVAGAAFLIVGLLDRAARFNGISMRIPFSDATMRLSYAGKAAGASTTEIPVGGPPRIYLAGGFKSGWQDQIRSEFAGMANFIDPRKHEIVPGKSYTAWDLKGVESSNLVFAYLESSNPGGYALALEIGYAKALGKTVIFVEDPPTASDERARYLEMLRATADYDCVSIGDGSKILRSLLDQHLLSR